MNLPGILTNAARAPGRRDALKFLSVALLVTTCALLPGPPAWSGKLPLERLFSAPDLSGPTLRGVKISPDGKLVAYLQARDDDKDRYDLWAYDVNAKRHRRLVDSRTLAGADRALSVEEEARRERQRTSAYSGIVEYSFAPDNLHLLIPLNGDLYVYDLAARPERAVRRLTNTEAFETDARFSPRSRYVSFIRDQNLYVVDLANGTERAITREGGGLVSYGVAEFIAQEEMDRDTGYWWSPDESRIALARVDEAPVAEVERFEIQATGARIVRQRYPAAGTANARVDLFVADLGTDGLRSSTSVPMPTSIYRASTGSRTAIPRRSAPEPRPEDARAAAIRPGYRPRPGAADRAQRHLGAAASRADLPAAHPSVHLGFLARRLPASVSLCQ